MVKVLLADAPCGSAALYVTVHVPAVVGVPLKVRGQVVR
jgi:hypothetical protein